MPAYKPCHQFGGAAATTDAVRHACGTCGGDKRLPTPDDLPTPDEARWADDTSVPC